MYSSRTLPHLLDMSINFLCCWFEMNSIPGIEQLLRQKVVIERKSFPVVSQELKEAYPNFTRSLSSWSVRWFCNQNGIHGTSRLTDANLDRVVANSVSMVHCYTEFYRVIMAIVYIV